MNSTAQWRSGINEWGSPCLWTCSGTHLIEWDGSDARVTPLGQRATALALSNGKFYFSAGSRTSISGVDGVLAFTNVDITSLAAPLAGDERIVIVQPGTNLVTLKDKTGAVPHVLQGVAYVGGQWLILVSREWTERSHRGETTKQELASFYLPQLPTAPIEVPTTGLEYLELSSAQEYFDLGRHANPLSEPGKPPDPIAIRRCSGRAFIFQRKDFQDQAGDLQLADMDRETMPVLEMLCSPSLADFDLTAALAYDEGHLLGTGDGYILSARIAQNRLSALARLDGKVLRLLSHSDHFYALTPGAIWQSATGASWDVLRAAFQDMTWRDALITEDGRLFAVENNGTDSRVSILSDIGVLLLDDVRAGKVLQVICEYSGGVYLFGESASGEYVIYDSENAATATTDEALAGETVTAAAALDDFLVVGTASGKILMLDGDGDWSLITTTTWPIAGFTVINGCLWIRYGHGVGWYSSWSSGDTDVTDHEFSAPCATAVRFFLDDNADGGEEGGSGSGSGSGSGGGGCSDCGLLLLTDAGPIWQTCAPDAVWFSETREAEAGEIFDEVLAFPLASDGSPLAARAFVGPADAEDDLTQFQPLEPGVCVRLLRPLSTLRFAVSHDEAQLHKLYEFVAYRRVWSE
jgi:hypothetical protein